MSSYPKVVTHHMAGVPGGDVIDLGGPCKHLKVFTEGECWVRAAIWGPNETPVAPDVLNATPAPAAAAEAPNGWVHLTDNTSYVFPPLLNGSGQYRFVELWEIDDAMIRLDGTDPGPFGRT